MTDGEPSSFPTTERIVDAHVKANATVDTADAEHDPAGEETVSPKDSTQYVSIGRRFASIKDLREHLHDSFEQDLAQDNPESPLRYQPPEYQRPAAGHVQYEPGPIDPALLSPPEPASVYAEPLINNRLGDDTPALTAVKPSDVSNHRPRRQLKRRRWLVPGLLAITGLCAGVVCSDSFQIWRMRQKSGADLERLVRKDPSAPWPAYVLAEQYSLQGRARETVKLLERASSARPNSFEMRFALGKALVLDNEPARAIPELHAAAQLQPTDSRTYQYLGTAQRLAGHLVDAREAEKIATDLDPKNADAWYEYGLCIIASRNPENPAVSAGVGAEYLTRAAGLEPDNPVFSSALGRMLARSPDTLEESLPYLRRAASGLKYDPAAHFILAGALLRNGAGGADLDEAIHELKTTIGLKPTSAQAHYKLGLALENRGDPGDNDRARREFEATIRLDPSFKEVYSHIPAAGNH